MTDATAGRGATGYDEVAYPTFSHSIAHPEALAMLARVYGLPYAPGETCRVLELGCGDGGHLIPIAEANPRARLLGVDLSRTAVERGRRDIAALGLDNVRLEVADVTTWRPEPGAFDYVVAHGLYAWVPPAVQEGAMAAAALALADGGLAMVSYNVAPGNNLRLMVRELLLNELEGVVGAGERLRRAQEVLEHAVDEVRSFSAMGAALHEEVVRWREAPPAVLAHDILGDTYAPARLTEVAAHGRRHGLSYLGDANGSHIRREQFPNETDARILAVSGGDLVAAEHRHDLRYGRVFRHTVLRKGPPDAPRALHLEALEGLHASLSPQLGERGTLGEEIDGVWTLTLSTNDGLAAKIGGARARRFIEGLAEVFPGSAPLADLGMAGEGLRLVAMLYASGAIQLRERALPMARTPGPRPRATAYARLQAATGRPSLTRLDHDMVRIDAMGAKLVTLMDGTRNVDDLVARLAEDTGSDLAALRAAVPSNLQTLCRMGLVLADDAVGG